jgi:hypothetical protein
LTALPISQIHHEAGWRLVKFVKELPREQLERKFLLRKMQDQQQRQGYDDKVKAWLEKPEQAELVKSLKATIRPNMSFRPCSMPRFPAFRRARSPSEDAYGVFQAASEIVGFRRGGF